METIDYVTTPNGVKYTIRTKDGLGRIDRGDVTTHRFFRKGNVWFDPSTGITNKDYVLLAHQLVTGTRIGWALPIR